MTNGEIIGLISIVLTLAGAAYTARVSGRAADRRTAADHDVTSGELALKIAQEADKKVTNLTKRLNAIQKWYRIEHEPWDDVVYEALNHVDPDLMKRIGRPTGMPQEEFND